MNEPVWTVSAMLISEFVIGSILMYKEKVFCNVLCPLFILFGLGFYMHTDIFSPRLWIGWTTFGVFRTLILMCFAYYSYRFAGRLRKMRLLPLGVVLISAGELCCFSMILLMILYCHSLNYLLIAMFIMALLCGIATSETSYSAVIFKDTKVSRYLGKLSFGIYLVHAPILAFFRTIFKTKGAIYSHAAEFAAVVLIASVCLLFFSELCIDLGRIIAASIKQRMFYR